MPSFRAFLQHLTLRQRILLLFAALADACLAALLLGLYFGYTKNQTSEALNALLIGGVLAGCAILTCIALLWRLFDENVGKPLERLAGELRARSHAEINTGLEDMQTRHLGDLVPAATALLRHLNEARNELAQTVARETTRLSAEKTHLAALLADLPVGILVCNARHQLVFYNGQAQAMLRASLMQDAQQLTPDAAEKMPGVARHRPDAPGPCPPGLLCLGRSLFDYLEDTAVLDALRQLHGLNNPDAGQPLSCLLRGSGHQLTGQIQLLSSAFATQGDGGHGYILALHADGPGLHTAAYDFDLLTRAQHTEFENTPLEALTYVVFDTETTGLLPGSGDEIVQLAAVRIVNGRRVETEVFNTLVNPGRAIPAASTRIHGITDAMVAEAPDIALAARRFHAFAQGAVLVAHNASFDMAFLQRIEARLGLRFDHPVLDTVLLSALVFGDAQHHSLDALCTRLNVNLPPSARHTALGDATATAEALLKLLPTLQARGLQTFGELDAECSRHRRLLRQGAG